MTRTKRTSRKKPSKAKIANAAKTSSPSAAWPPSLALVSRFILPFVVLTSLFVIGAAILFSGRGARGDAPSKQDVVTIAFVEADLPAPDADSNTVCSTRKMDAVWKETENLVAAFWKHAVAAPPGANWSLWMYSLNSAPGAGRELIRIGSHELADVTNAKGLTRTQREENGWKKYAQAARKEYENSLEPNPRQNIISTVRFLLTNRRKFIGENVGTIKLVYLSDMFHYNCDVAAMDPEAGYWNFLSLDAIEKFQSQIDQGVLYHHDGEMTSVSVPVEPLVDKTDDTALEVFSISIPRLPCETLPSQEINRIQATGQIQKTWERLFEKMNAKSVLLNVDADRVF